MPVTCRYVPLAELSLDAADAAHWLSPRERTAWAAMQAPQRRDTYLAGRIVAKRLLTGILELAAEPDLIDIDTAPLGSGRADRPRVFVRLRPLVCSLSIAHTARGVLVALADEDDVRLGVDLVEPTDRAGELGWTMTAEERRWLDADEGNCVEQLWAMKEAVYKACQNGEGFAPRAIEVVPGQEARYAESRISKLQCWRVDAQHAALAVAHLET